MKDFFKFCVLFRMSKLYDIQLHIQVHTCMNSIDTKFAFQVQILFEFLETFYLRCSFNTIRSFYWRTNCKIVAKYDTSIHPINIFLFQAHLGLSREDFMAAPRWKQLEIRKEKGLFWIKSVLLSKKSDYFEKNEKNH